MNRFILYSRRYNDHKTWNLLSIITDILVKKYYSEKNNSDFWRVFDDVNQNCSYYFFMLKNWNKQVKKHPKNEVFCVFWGRNLQILQIKFKVLIAFFESFQMPFLDFMLLVSRFKSNHQNSAVIKVSIFHKRLNWSVWKFNTEILCVRSNFYLWQFFSLSLIVTEIWAFT